MEVDVSDRPFRLCRVCRTPNAADLLFCDSCRSSLAGTTEVTEEEADAVFVRRGERRRFRRWHWLAGTLLVLVTAVAGTCYYRLRPPEPLPKPLTSIGSTSVSGQWARPGFDFANSRNAPALRPFAGQVRWRSAAPGPFSTAPIVRDNVVYVATTGGSVLSIDAASGERNWEFVADAPIDADPTIAGDWLFVVLRDGRILSLDRHSGALLWSYETSSVLAGGVLVANGEVYVSNLEGRLTTLDAATGRQRWRSKPGRADGNITLAGSILAVTTNNSVFTFDAKTGSEIHHHRLLTRISTPIAVAGGIAYAGDIAGNIWSFDIDYRPEWYLGDAVRRSWEVLYVWGVASSPPADGDLRVFHAHPGTIAPFAIDEHRLYLGNSEGLVLTVERDTFQTAWSVDLGPGPIGATVLGGSTLYVAGADGLHALDSASGAAKWFVPTGGGIPTTPAVTDYGIFVTTGDGEVLALD